MIFMTLLLLLLLLLLLGTISMVVPVLLMGTIVAPLVPMVVGSMITVRQLVCSMVTTLLLVPIVGRKLVVAATVSAAHPLVLLRVRTVVVITMLHLTPMVTTTSGTHCASSVKRARILTIHIPVVVTIAIVLIVPVVRTIPMMVPDVVLPMV